MRLRNRKLLHMRKLHGGRRFMGRGIFDTVVGFLKSDTAKGIINSGYDMAVNAVDNYNKKTNAPAHQEPPKSIADRAIPEGGKKSKRVQTDEAKRKVLQSLMNF